MRTILTSVPFQGPARMVTAPTHQAHTPALAYLVTQAPSVRMILTSVPFQGPARMVTAPTHQAHTPALAYLVTQAPSVRMILMSACLVPAAMAPRVWREIPVHSSVCVLRGLQESCVAMILTSVSTIPVLTQPLA